MILGYHVLISGYIRFWGQSMVCRCTIASGLRPQRDKTPPHRYYCFQWCGHLLDPDVAARYLCVVEDTPLCNLGKLWSGINFGCRDQ